MPLRSARVLLVLMCSVFPQAVRALEAEIVLLQGRGEKSASAEPTLWTAAIQGDRIAGGYWVRTLANSQMGLTVPERNQIRLNQNSTLQIKTAAEAAAFLNTRLKLLRGRAWSQARPRAPAAGARAAPPLVMETPSATLSIRGTDWEVEVSETGGVQVVVLSGRVDVGNAQGSVSVGAGEAARAEMGKAPVKLQLVDPAARVQWVSSWEPRGARWVGSEAPRYARELHLIGVGDYGQARDLLLTRARNETGAAVLAADLLIYEGEIERAVGLVEPHARAGRGDERAVALLARALLRLDRVTAATELLGAGLVAHPGAVELLLAQGEIAVLEGDATLARDAYGAVAHGTPGAGVLAEQAQRSEGWFGLGLVSSEREFVRAARRELAESLRLDPGLGKAAAELAAVETFAGNLSEAKQRYDALLAENAANYQALTGRGINRLKQGDPAAALDDFLKAGLIEPRYARAWLYQGVAFYQLGEFYRAEQAFGKAEALDPKDPVGHMLESQVAADSLDYGRAIGEAREARRKMPFLKSLNQLQNDQKGSANVGAPLAGFGLEEWAKYYADAASTPYWGGSQLFLADRYTGLFTKNSALMTGFLADPLAFGASNRRAALVQTPGHYQRIDLDWERDDYETPGASATLNGQVEAPMRAAYFLRSEAQRADSRHDRSVGDKVSLTAGLGLAPREDLGIFGFFVDNTLRADIHGPGSPDANLQQSDRVADLGLRWKRSPENQLWLKGGYRRQRSDRSGVVLLPELAAQLRPLVREFNGFLPYLPGYVRDIPLPGARGGIDSLLRIEGEDLQFRHAFSVGDARWSWGVEHAQQEQSGSSRVTLRPLRSDYAEALRTETGLAWAGVDFPLAASWEAALALHAQEADGEWRVYAYDDLLPWYLPPELSSLTLPSLKVTDAQGTELDLRAGLSWRPTSGQRLRLVSQQWHRPASFGTLSPVETLGIALDDRLSAPGGAYQRVRLQYDGELGQRWFLQVFADHESVDNGLAGRRTVGFSYQIEALAELRQTGDFFTPGDELEEIPIFPRGSVDTLGVAVDLQASERLALRARYLRRDSDNEVAGPEGRDWVPYVPKDQMLLRAQWNSPWRLLLSANAVWRGERLQGELGVVDMEPLALVVNAGWSFGLGAYWESLGKHHSAQVLVDDLAPDGDAMSWNHRDPLFRLQYAYRF
jgi:tetratricopeptide (TPR) repeat protein